MQKRKRKPTAAEIAKAEAERKANESRVRAAKRVAGEIGLDLVVLEYGNKVGQTIRRADVWAIHCRGVEVGHWVPATERYRVGPEYGGPAPFAEVVGRLAEIHLGNEQRELRKTA